MNSSRDRRLFPWGMFFPRNGLPLQKALARLLPALSIQRDDSLVSTRRGGFMSEARTTYAQAREALLAHITDTLKRDQRFVAAWLAGSYGRGEQQWSSDLDLHVVVANDYSERLCAQ